MTEREKRIVLEAVRKLNYEKIIKYYKKWKLCYYKEGEQYYSIPTERELLKHFNTIVCERYEKSKRTWKRFYYYRAYWLWTYFDVVDWELNAVELLFWTIYSTCSSKFTF